MATYRVVRHPLVSSDLINLVNLVADYAGAHVAERKIAEIEQTIETLRHTPHLGSLRDEIYPDLRAIPVADKGVLCFTVDDDTLTVAIICIAYAGADWSSSVARR